MEDSEKPYCLVVDDHEDCREVGRILCKSIGMTVDGAADGEQALALCNERMPELILLDWKMPKMDGIEFLKALRKIEGGEKVNVLMCSAMAGEKDIEQAFAAGANGYLAKPFNPPQLMENIVNTDWFEKLKRPS